MEKRRFAILGFGSRGQLFGDFIAGDDGAELVAVADTAKVCRETARDKFHVPSDAIFDSAESFLQRAKSPTRFSSVHRIRIIAPTRCGQCSSAMIFVWKNPQRQTGKIV